MTYLIVVLMLLWQNPSQKLNAHSHAAKPVASTTQQNRWTQPVPNMTWHDCHWAGSYGNFAGYQTEAEHYQCKEGTLRIEGRWSEAIQNGWQYHTTLGRSDGSGPMYVGDLPLSQQMPKFQKWCKTQYGYELCGWNEAEEARQRALEKTRKAPPMKR